MGDGKTEAVHFLSLNLDLDNAICPVKRTKAFYCPSFFCLLVCLSASQPDCLSILGVGTVDLPHALSWARAL